jgi:hypothetical protein
MHTAAVLVMLERDAHGVWHVYGQPTRDPVLILGAMLGVCSDPWPRSARQIGRS